LSKIQAELLGFQIKRVESSPPWYRNIFFRNR
jgi:hypothetical protein